MCIRDRSSCYREDGDAYHIKVRYAPQFRTSIESLENILIYTNEGKAIRVKDIGTVAVSYTHLSILFAK